MSNQELTQIFYDFFGPQDRYLLDAASGDTFMRKFENDAMELIETVAKNRHHNVTKLFVRGAMPKGQLIDAKSAKTGMLLERINKMAEVHNLLIDRLNIRKGFEGLTPISLQEASPCTNCSRLDPVELGCPVMAVQGHDMYRQGPMGGPSQQAQPSDLGSYSNYYSNHVFNKNPSQSAGFRRNNSQTYPPTYNTSKQQI